MAERKYYICCLIFLFTAVFFHFKHDSHKSSLRRFESDYTKLLKKIELTKSSESDLYNDSSYEGNIKRKTFLEGVIEKETRAVRTFSTFEYSFLLLGLFLWFLSIRKKEPVFHSVPIITVAFYVIHGYCYTWSY